MKMEWFGFWIFLAVFVACDHWIFAQGYDSFFQNHKTEVEKVDGTNIRVMPCGRATERL
jgi:hypothetical protein